ncbi:MAG: hypothetical protein Q9169_005060 [Polycauliona sp. 2 TL-2023]
MAPKSTKNPGNRVRDTSKPNPKKQTQKQKPQSKSSIPPKDAPKQQQQQQQQQNLDSNTKSTPHHPLLPLKSQQRILNGFSSAFHDRLSDIEKMKSDVQILKGFLFNRDFENAFGVEGLLEAYAVRWSAARAVAYFSIFTSVDCLYEGWRKVRREGDEGRRGKVVCLGGGAGAEVVALGEMMGSEGGDGGDGEAKGRGEGEAVDVVVVDIGPWFSVLGKLKDAITATPASSSPSPSQPSPDPTSDQLADGPLTHSSNLNLIFQQHDILSMQDKELQLLYHDAKIVTLMFTLNELYSTSIAKTTKMLLDLTGLVAKGCIVVVVDSPGSYSTLALNNSGGRVTNSEGKGEDGKEGDDGDVKGEREGEKKVEVKKYPMKWLLDHTLLEAANDGEAKWEKLHSEDSRWFRLREELRYPIDLEDMRMQVHVYGRL